MFEQVKIDFTKKLRFDGDDYVHARDSKRLTGQLKDIFTFMMDGRWHTLTEISKATDAPEASVSAQLRNLRKPRFGGHVIERRSNGNGLYEYKLST